MSIFGRYAGWCLQASEGRRERVERVRHLEFTVRCGTLKQGSTDYRLHRLQREYIGNVMGQMLQLCMIGAAKLSAVGEFHHRALCGAMFILVL